MAGNTNFPTALDDDSSLIDVTDGVTAIEAAHHNNLKEAVKALQAKVGIFNTAAPTAIDYRLGHPSFGHRHDGASGQGVLIESGGATFLEGHPSYASTGNLRFVSPARTIYPYQGTSNASAWENTYIDLSPNGELYIGAPYYMEFSQVFGAERRHDTKFFFFGGWGLVLPSMATSQLHATYSEAGQIYYDSAADKLKLWTGATWRSLSME